MSRYRVYSLIPAVGSGEVVGENDHVRTCVTSHSRLCGCIEESAQPEFITNLAEALRKFVSGEPTRRVGPGQLKYLGQISFGDLQGAKYRCISQVNELLETRIDRKCETRSFRRTNLAMANGGPTENFRENCGLTVRQVERRKSIQTVESIVGVPVADWRQQLGRSIP
jgi:hypothetical protein